MAESTVKVPSQEAQGMDFLAFSFNGKHSWDDFHIYRTSDGDRYNENLTPTLNDKTAEVPGGDGMYYFGTTHKQRDFNISFAFDGLTEVELRELKKWLNGKEMGDLWFQEAPYKVWTAKPAGNSSIKYIPFDDENGQRVYKGEGTVQFVAYWPYAHTPDFVATYSTYYDITINDSPEYYQLSSDLSLNSSLKIWIWEEDVGYVTDCGLEYCSTIGEYGQFSSREGYYYFDSTYDITITSFGFTRPLSCQIYVGELDNLIPIELKDLKSNGLLLSSYNQFGNKDQWADVSGLTDTFTPGDNDGDLPAPFVLTKTSTIGTEDESSVTFTIGDCYITVPAERTTVSEDTTTYTHYKNLTWDSKTGMVSAQKSNATGEDKPKPIPYTGNSIGTIPVGGLTEDKISLNEAFLIYHYWYY